MTNKFEDLQFNGASNDTFLVYQSDAVASGGAFLTETSEAVSFSGPWAAPQAVDVDFALFGNIATMSCEALSAAISGATNTTNITVAAGVPAAYRPSTTRLIPVVLAIGTSGNIVGLVRIETNGNITIASVAADLTSSYAGSDGVTAVGLPNGFAVSWML